MSGQITAIRCSVYGMLHHYHSNHILQCKNYSSIRHVALCVKMHGVYAVDEIWTCCPWVGRAKQSSTLYQYGMFASLILLWHVATVCKKCSVVYFLPSEWAYQSNPSLQILGGGGGFEHQRGVSHNTLLSNQCSLYIWHVTPLIATRDAAIMQA